MARSLRIPGIDRSGAVSMRVGYPRPCRRRARLDRGFDARGPLINRLIVGASAAGSRSTARRYPRWRRATMQVRAEHQQELCGGGSIPPADAAVERRTDRCACRLRLRRHAAVMPRSILTQQIVGRFVRSDFTAPIARAGKPPSCSTDFATASRRSRFLAAHRPTAPRTRPAGRARQGRPLDHARHRNRRAWPRARLRAHARIARDAALARRSATTPWSGSACAPPKRAAPGRPCRDAAVAGAVAPGTLVMLELETAGPRRAGRRDGVHARSWTPVRRTPSSRPCCEPCGAGAYRRPSSHDRRNCFSRRREHPAMTDDVIFTPLKFRNLRSRTGSSGRTFPAGSTTRTVRSRRPASTGNASSPTAASARSSPPTCRC